METGRDLIVVAGATGKQGGAVARELIGRGHRVRAMTRKPGSAAADALRRAGAEVVEGDLDDEASLGHVLAGAWGAFALQNSWEAGPEGEERQGKRFAHSARNAGVQHLVYTSVASAQRATDIPHFDSKFHIEETVRSLGFPSHTVIRPVFFMENFLAPGAGPDAEGRLSLAIEPTTSLQMIAVADVGRYGCTAFERHDEMNGLAIDIAGDELMLPDAAGILSHVTGRAIRFVRTPIEDVRQWSMDAAIMFEWFDRVGYDVDIEGNARTWGITPTSFHDWAHSVEWTIS